MIAPEVWTFKPQKSLLLSGEGNDKLLKTIKGQIFNHMVTVLCPDALSVPNSVMKSLTEDTDYYCLSNFPVYEFINTQFIEYFIKKGSVNILSNETHIDQDDCCNITPDGVFTLSLNKKLFQELGLEGKKSKFYDKFIVSFDLKTLIFGSKSYQRLTSRLKLFKNILKMDFILIWEPYEEKVCPSSVAEYFFLRGYQVHTCRIKQKKRIDYNVNVPQFDNDSIEDILEWAGWQSLQCQQKETISSYQIPEPNSNFGQVSFFQCQGFLSYKVIEEFFKLLQDWHNGRNTNSFIFACVHGFQDSIFNHNNQEQHFYTNGDYHYSVILRKKLPPICTSFISNSKHMLKRSRKWK